MSEASWVHDLSPEMRARLADLHRVDRRRSLARIFAYLSMWAGAGTLACACPSLWVRVPCWALIGLCLHGLGDFMHMCGHGRVFGLGWVDRAVGFLCGLPVFVSSSCYWAGHRLHHRWLGTERDPDSLARIRSPRARLVLIRLYVLVGFPLFALRLAAMGPLWAASVRERLFCLLEMTAMVAFYVAVLGGGPHPVLIDGWLMALPYAMIVANLRGLAEHTLLPAGRLTRTTRTSPWLQFFFNNQNFHREHHQLPSLPWHALPDAHGVLGGPAADGYLEFAACIYNGAGS